MNPNPQATLPEFETDGKTIRREYKIREVAKYLSNRIGISYPSARQRVYDALRDGRIRVEVTVSKGGEIIDAEAHQVGREWLIKRSAVIEFVTGKRLRKQIYEQS
jgi:hypothetical protein